MPYLAPTVSTAITVRISADKALPHYLAIYTTPASSAPKYLQDLINANLAGEHTDTSAQLHLQIPATHISPLFTVDFYTRGQRYHLVSSRGITQWYTEPYAGGRSTNCIDRNSAVGSSVVRAHGFFAGKLMSVRWRVWNLLIYLQRAHLCLPLAGGREKDSWWVVNVGLCWGKGPEDPATSFVTLYVREDTRVSGVFEVLAGHGVEGWFSLTQWCWPGVQMGRPRCWYYDDALECGVTLKESGWRGSSEEAVWLKTQAG